MDQVGGPLAGDLGEVSFPQLLRKLHTEAVTGRLTLTQLDIAKTIHFQEGRLVFARSNNPDDRLGEYLLRRGVISLEQYQESARRIGQDKRQGTVLCEIRAIQAEDLVRYVTEQVTEILYSLFSWARGEFRIELGADDPQERVVLALPVEEVILQGMRRVDDWQRIWRGIGASLETRFAPLPSAEGLSYRGFFTDDEAHVLSTVNGKLTVARLADLSYVSNFETCRILWALLVVGAIEVVAEESDPGSSGVGEDFALVELVEAYDRLFLVVHAFVSERIGDLVDHLLDRAVHLCSIHHGEVLADVHLRNQGRVEYEHIHARLSGYRAAERRARAVAVLDELLRVLRGLTAKELGLEEVQLLDGELGQVAHQVPQVALEELLAEPGSSVLAHVNRLMAAEGAG